MLCVHLHTTDGLNVKVTVLKRATIMEHVLLLLLNCLRNVVVKRLYKFIYIGLLHLVFLYNNVMKVKKITIYYTICFLSETEFCFIFSIETEDHLV